MSDAHLALPYFDSLLPPLWGVAASYLDLAELWFYNDFIPHRPSPRPSPRPGLRSGLSTVFECVIVNNHTHMLDEIYKTDKCSYNEVAVAIRHDRVEILEWLFKNHPNIIIPYYVMYDLDAAAAGAVRVLMWENETKLCPWSLRTCARLAYRNRFDALRRLRECSAPWDCNTYAWAVLSGNVEMVKWIESVDPSITNIDVSSHIDTVPMLDHFLDRAVSLPDGKIYPLIERACVAFSWESFCLVIKNRMFDKVLDAATVVYWVACHAEDHERVKFAVDCGYSLPSPHIYLRLSERKTRENLESVGWRPA